MTEKWRWGYLRYDYRQPRSWVFLQEATLDSRVALALCGYNTVIPWDDEKKFVLLETTSECADLDSGVRASPELLERITRIPEYEEQIRRLQESLGEAHVMLNDAYARIEEMEKSR